MDSKQVYVIRIADLNNQGAFYITDAEPSDWLGIPCIKGKSVALKPIHWAEGTTTYVPLDKIAGIVVFDSVESWRENDRKHRAANQTESRG